MANVLFVCVQNAGRSQLAEALFVHAAGDRHPARSAGSAPAAEVHPNVVEVMPELAGRVPRKLEQADAEWADVVVTMGCGDACPWLPARQRADWELPDPKNLPIEQFRDVRDDIESRVLELIKQLGSRPVI